MAGAAAQKGTYIPQLHSFTGGRKRLLSGSQKQKRQQTWPSDTAAPHTQSRTDNNISQLRTPPNMTTNSSIPPMTSAQPGASTPTPTQPQTQTQPQAQAQGQAQGQVQSASATPQLIRRHLDDHQIHLMTTLSRIETQQQQDKHTASSVAHLQAQAPTKSNLFALAEMSGIKSTVAAVVSQRHGGDRRRALEEETDRKKQEQREAIAAKIASGGFKKKPLLRKSPSIGGGVQGRNGVLELSPAKSTSLRRSNTSSGSGSGSGNGSGSGSGGSTPAWMQRGAPLGAAKRSNRVLTADQASKVGKVQRTSAQMQTLHGSKGKSQGTGGGGGNPAAGASFVAGGGRNRTPKVVGQRDIAQVAQQWHLVRTYDILYGVYGVGWLAVGRVVYYRSLKPDVVLSVCAGRPYRQVTVNESAAPCGGGEGGMYDCCIIA